MSLDFFNKKATNSFVAEYLHIYVTSLAQTRPTALLVSVEIKLGTFFGMFRVIINVNHRLGYIVITLNC